MVWRGQVRHGVAGRVRLGAVRIDAEWMGKQGPDGRGTARLRTDRNGRHVTGWMGRVWRR